MNLLVPTPGDFSFQETLDAHGWRRLAPFAWDEERQTLTRAEDFGDGRVAALEISVQNGEVVVQTDADCAEARLSAQVRRMLQLDLPLREFHAYCRTRPELAHLEACRKGRLLRSPTLFEDTVKVIATTNTTWTQTIAMSARLVSAFGTEGRTFPTAKQIADVPFDEFAAKARMGYRSASVYAIASAVSDGSLDLEAWQSESLAASDLRKRLLSLPGIGPYAAACLMLYLGRPDQVNADSWARALLGKELGHTVTDKEVHAFFEAHGAWRGLVYCFYPWKS